MVEINDTASAASAIYSAQTLDKKPPPGFEKRNLLRSAIRCFASQGFEKASAKMITGDAGLSPAMVNYYFLSKSELYIEALKTSVDLLAEHIQQQTEAQEHFEDYLLALLQAYVSFANDYSDAAMLVIRSSYSIGKLPANSKAEAAISHTYSSIRERLRNRLSLSIDNGTFIVDNNLSQQEMLDFILGECEYIFMRRVQARFFESQVPRPIPEVDTIRRIFLRAVGR